MEEIWKDVPWYEGLYQIDINNNTVMSLNYRRGKLSKILSMHKWHRWHISCILCSKNTQRRMYIHQIVMLIKEWTCPDWMEVCHNDGNPANNHPDNLRYDTRSENEKDKYRHWYIHPNTGNFWKENKCSKSVMQYSKKWVFIKQWDSLIDIERELCIKRQNIYACCRGIRKTIGGFVWKYKNYDY